MNFFQRTTKKYTILTGIVLVGFMFLFIPLTTRAISCDKVEEQGKIVLQVEIPFVTSVCEHETFAIKGAAAEKITVKKYYVDGMESYIAGIYNFFIGAIALAAVVMIMVGGFQWMVAAGNQSRISNAKTTITSAVSGLLLALMSYTLLNAISPRFTSLDIQGPSDVNEISQLNSFYCIDVNDNLITSSDKKLTPITFDPNVECYTTSNYTGDKTYIGDASCLQKKKDVSKLKDETACGKLYRVTADVISSDKKTYQSLGNACVGRLCPEKDGKAQICRLGECTQGSLTGSITGNFIDSTLSLYRVCEKGDVIQSNTYSRNDFSAVQLNKDQKNAADKVDTQELGTKSEQYTYGYVFSYLPPASDCPDSKVLGYFLQAEVDDNWGVDDEYLIDNTGQKPIALCQKFDSTTKSHTYTLVSAASECSGGTYISEAERVVGYLKEVSSVELTKRLIPASRLDGTNTQPLNLDLSATNFPSR